MNETTVVNKAIKKLVQIALDRKWEYLPSTPALVHHHQIQKNACAEIMQKLTFYGIVDRYRKFDLDKKNRLGMLRNLSSQVTQNKERRI